MVTHVSAIFCSGWPTFFALGTLGLYFLPFALWTYISYTLHFGAIFLALYTLDLYYLHFSLWTYISCTLHFAPIFLALCTHNTQHIQPLSSSFDDADDDDDGDSKCEDDEAARVSSLWAVSIRLFTVSQASTALSSYLANRSIIPILKGWSHCGSISIFTT